MYERDEFLRDRIRPHQPGTPRGYSPRSPSGDRCPAPPPGRHAAAATPPGPPRLPSAPLRPLPDPAWPRQPEAPPPSTWADPALAPIRSRTRPGERGWRRMVRLVTFGLVGLGRSGMQRQEAQFEATIRTVLHGNHKVAVLGKGGVGKTSVAACVGSILAELRQQDRIVGIDADTAFGRLSSRIDPRAAGSFWELTTDTNLRSFTDITARLGRNSAGLYVLAGQPASGPRRVLDPAIYREAALRLDHHFAISVIDCGSSMEAAVTQEVLRDVDALIVVSSPWADGASAAANTIEWLSDYGLTGLLRRSIVVLNDSDGHADKRTKSLLAQEFIDHGQPVVEVPFDPHLRPGGGHRYEPRNGPDDAAENPAGRRDGDGVLRVATRRRTRQPAPVTWLADPVGNSRIARAQACKTSISAPIVESWRAQRGAQCGQREKSCRCSRAVHIQGISPPLFRRPLEPAVQAAVASCRLGRHPVVAHRVTVALGQGSQLAQRECPRPA